MPTEKLKEEQELEKKLFQQNAEILQETGMGDGSSLLQPASSQPQQEGEDEDDNLKMNIKIFRVSPTNKHKTKHTRDTKEDLVEVETQITLEEEAGKYMHDLMHIALNVKRSKNIGNQDTDNDDGVRQLKIVCEWYNTTVIKKR